MPGFDLADSAAAIATVLVSALAMYLAVLLLARWAGVRSFAEMSTFDIAITIAIGSTVATTVVGEDPPLIRGVSALAGLYAIQLAVSRLRHRSRALERRLDNRPILVMGRGGRLLPESMRAARITEDDLRSKLRRANVADPARVRAVIMEGTGEVNVLHGHDRPLHAWLLQGVRDYDGELRRTD
jgi:uncharacterized membrane protein YcaP (DUF421 family)